MAKLLVLNTSFCSRLSVWCANMSPNRKIFLALVLLINLFIITYCYKQWMKLNAIAKHKEIYIKIPPFYICRNSRSGQNSIFSMDKRAQSTHSPCVELSCHTCALVTGSGHLYHSNLGKEIDSKDCVIRTNDAPIMGFESDVGIRTTLRNVDARSLGFYVEELARNQNSFGQNNDILLVFRPTQLPNAVLAGVQKTLSADNIFQTTPKQFNKTIAFFEQMVLNSSRIDPENWMSSGFYTLFTAHQFCDEIHVYGIAPENYCEQSHHHVPYHYYDKRWWPFYETECAMFKYNAKVPKERHYFYEEKRAFSQLINDWDRLYFHAPEWAN